MVTNSQIRRIATILLGCALVAVLLSTASAAAQGRVEPSETTLTFQGLVTEPMKRTFVLQVEGDPVRNVSIVRHDLRDTSTGNVVLSSNITVEPLTRDEISDQASFDVTIGGISKPGHYTGTLDIHYDGLPITAPLSINLDLKAEAVPAVDADVASKSLTLFVQPPFTAQQSIFVVQGANNEAVVEDARVLTLRGTKGQSLLGNTVQVDATFPLTLPERGTAPITLTVSSNNLPAGEYNGTLYVRVKNQPAPVQVPLTVKVKDPPYLPFLALIGGIAVAAILGWWTGTGKAQRDLITPIQNLAKDIQSGGKVQTVDRDHAMELLAQAWTDLNAGVAPADIQKNYDAALKIVTEARTAADQFLTQKMPPLSTRLSNLTPGRTVREGLQSSLTDIGDQVTEGKWATLHDAESALQNLTTKVSQLADLVAKFAEVSEDKKELVAKELDSATAYQAMRIILTNAGVTVPFVPGISFDVRQEPVARAVSDQFRLERKRKILLSAGKVFAAAIVYVFALWVGWVTLYVKSDTFGTDAQEYITLFLWGSVIETVRGKTVSLGTLETIVKKQ